MTDKEAAEAEKTWNEWFEGLNFNVKSDIYTLVKPLVEMSECQHNFYDTDGYKNDFESGTLICRKCGIHTNKSKLEAQVIQTAPEMKICSGCGGENSTVDRHLFDGMCTDCTTRGLYNHDFAVAARKRNEQLIKKEA